MTPPIISLARFLQKNDCGIKKKKLLGKSFLWFSKTSEKTCKNVPLKTTKSTKVNALLLLLFDGRGRCPLLSSPAVSCSTHRYKSPKMKVKVVLFFLYIFLLVRLSFYLRVFIFLWSVLRLFIRIVFKHRAAIFPHLTWCVSPALVGTQFALIPERSHRLHTLELHFFLLRFICNANAKETAAILHVRYQSKAGGEQGGVQEEEKINKTAG